nr:uncharacterized protein LOC111418960 [Onthophagus taurus]
MRDIRRATKPHKQKYDTSRYGTVSKIQNALPIAKEKLTPLKGAGVYRLSCSCGKYYVGQTGRNIECRIKEHERDVRLRKIQQSAVAEHCHKGGHSIEFEKTKVLARNGHYFQRLTRAAIEIHRHGNNMNRQDGWELSRTWKMLVNPTKFSPPGFNKTT